VAKLFFLLSGENPTLPFSEAKSILKAEGFKYQVLEELAHLLRVEADIKCIESVKSRSSLTKTCGIEVFNCEANAEEILENLQKAEINSFIRDGESFVVRVSRIRGCSPNINGWMLEQKIGEIILNKLRWVKVNLKVPQRTFLGILTENKFIFGLKLADIKSKSFIERGPRKKVFFHPAAMSTKLARCMINLAQAKKNDLVLDPFCGTGSILLEAGLIGCSILGFDLNRRMVIGSLQNLRYYGVEPLGIILSDARLPPLNKNEADCVVTDPPYGLSASTFGLKPQVLFEDFLSAIGEKVKRGGRLCIAAPKSLEIDELGSTLGFRHIESHFIHIHRRLTREILVFERD